MKTILISLVFLAGISLLPACKHTQYTAANLPAKQLRWGKGGGIVGKETAWTLLENGQIFKRDGANASLTPIEGTKSKTSTALFKTADALGLQKVDFVHPGNMYSFIEVPDGQKTKRISWGDPKLPVDPKILDLYNQLVKLAPGN
jgi:hypothetical protein